VFPSGDAVGGITVVVFIFHIGIKAPPETNEQSFALKIEAIIFLLFAIFCLLLTIW
jgi:hypothetical protein